MDFLGQVAAWYTDPAQWSGRDTLPELVVATLVLAAISLAIALLIALPVGLYIGHTGRGAQAAVAIANIGRAVPSLGWMGIAYPITTGLFARAGNGLMPAVIALAALGIPPIVTNAYAGLREVDPDLREAGRGVGMTEMQLLGRVEVPVALPVIMAGVRSSAVAIVATTPLMSLVGADTLGDYIISGLNLSDEVQMFAAALLVVVAALATELLFAWLERRTTSPGILGRGVDRGTDDAGRPGRLAAEG
ncbi:MAG TPA: ABC transporter permease [Candidatus Limnocylindria bacterium]|jgi:osmoprotectant transport system permease protein|nr:ABC transporter permease [Candidatus Limnocylindria bacterium]